MKRNYNLLKGLMIFLIFLLSCESRISKQEYYTDFVTIDVHNFYNMFHKLEKANSLVDTLQLLNDEFIEKASRGLKAYFDYETTNNSRNIEQEYLNILRLFPKYIESQEPLLTQIDELVPHYNNYFKKIKNIYPEATFPPVYFAFGIFNTNGQMIPPSTVFIGLETSLTNKKTNFIEFPESYLWIRDDSSNYKDVGYIVVHESLHTLQSNSDDYSLLSQAITEGAAVFLTKYICGEESLIGNAGITQKMLDYANSNKNEIWRDFQMDIQQSQNFDKWFWSSNSDYPYSMGYYMGYKICQSYYSKHINKEQALLKLIKLKNFEEIYEQSEYYEPR